MYKMVTVTRLQVLVIFVTPAISFFGLAEDVCQNIYHTKIKIEKLGNYNNTYVIFVFRVLGTHTAGLFFKM